MKRVAKILFYNPAHELGVVRADDGQYWIVDGPITQDGPNEWLMEDSGYESIKQKYARKLEEPL